MHYKRWWRYGSVYTVKQFSEQFSLQERLTTIGYTVADNGCWEWNGRVHRLGYGEIDFAGHSLKAHRAFYETFVGPIPEGLFVCHSCDNRKCVNYAEHLWLGDAYANMQDMAAKGRGGLSRGEKSGTAKMTDSTVTTLRADRVAGDSLKVLAERYGIAQSTVSSIVRRRTWTHIH